MNRFHPAVPSREFYATRFGKVKTLALFLGLTGLFTWVAWQFRDPDFLADTTGHKLAFIRDMIAALPAGGGAVIFALLAMLCAYATVKTVVRIQSGLPELILSEAGINAYPNLRANSHGFISWDDLASVSTYNRSVMIFYGKRASLMGKRTVLAVNLSEIGIAKKEMDTLLEASVAAGNLARNSGRAPVDFVYPSLPAKAPAASATPQMNRPAMPQPVQRSYRASPAQPDFGRRMTRI
mgnify:FL=1